MIVATTLLSGDGTSVVQAAVRFGASGDRRSVAARAS